VCGGCQLQHLGYAHQLEAKAAILRDQLQRIGGISDPPILPGVGGQPWNYRNHVQFHLTPEGRLGYYRRGGAGVFPIQECHLPEAPIDQLWPQLDVEAIPGLERLGIRLGVEDDLQVILESSDLQAPEISIEELPVSVVHLSPAGALVLAGSPAVQMKILERRFQVSAGSFFQVNSASAEAMVHYLLNSLPLEPGMQALEVYCGVGLFSAFLAPHIGRMVGIEASPDACADFVVNLDEFDNVELYEAPAEDVLPLLEMKPDLVLVDPPRAGLALPVLDGILRLSAPWLAYVSCDPATLARDARRLQQGGYQLTQIRVFDLFPQTHHIESISLWQRAKKG
jgi:23S rRNA (uracil1939-C5)-methyltransferase